MAGARTDSWLRAHVIDCLFVVIAAVWLWYLLDLLKYQSFWADDLRVIQRASDGDLFLAPYDRALSLVSMVVYRVAIQAGHFAYWPFTVAGLLALLSVPVAYFVTTRRLLGPALAGVLAMSLLWYDRIDPWPAQLNHFLVLTMAIVSAGALNRGRRADWVLAAGLVVALASAGGGLVVVLACLVHSAITRPHRRRWMAIFGPAGLYFVWYVRYRPETTGHVRMDLSEQVQRVNDLLTVPFYHVGFGRWPLAVLAAVAFVAWGVYQLRQGLRAGANFIAWTVALVAWPVALVQVRGPLVVSTTFRFAIVSLGFALLAVVPKRPITWPPLTAPDRRWVAAGAAAFLLVAGVRAHEAQPWLDASGVAITDRGRKVEAAMRVVRLEPEVIPASTKLRFYAYPNPHGRAGLLRQLLDRYHAPFHPSPATIDQELVDTKAVNARIQPPRRPPTSCQSLTTPLTLAPTTIGEDALGEPTDGPQTDGPPVYDLWSPNGFTVEMRRFGDHFVHLADVPPARDAILTLPLLSSDTPYQIRATGACIRN